TGKLGGRIGPRASASYRELGCPLAAAPGPLRRTDVAGAAHPAMLITAAHMKQALRKRAIIAPHTIFGEQRIRASISRRLASNCARILEELRRCSRAKDGLRFRKSGPRPGSRTFS